MIRPLPTALRRTAGLLFYATIQCACSVETESLQWGVARAPHSGVVTVSGRILPRHSAMIGSRLSGHIKEWPADENGRPLDVGATIKAGQLLFAVDQSTYQARAAALRAVLASAEATLVNLKAPTRKERLDGLRAVLDELDARTRDRERDLARFTRLVEVDRTAPPRRLEEIRLELDLLKAQRAAAQARLDEAVNGPTPTEIALAEARVTEARTMLATAELDLKDTLVLAPFDGVITRRFKGLGDYVAGVPFVDVLELIGTTELEAELHLPEAFLTLMTPGKTRLRLKAQALEKELDLAVTQVVPRVNAQEGTFPVRADVPPAQRGGLTPGTFVTAEFQFERTESDVIVPLRAVFEESKDYYVVVAEEEKMLRRRVATSHRLTEGIVVKSGLRAGEKVVLGLKTLPRDGTPLPAELRSSQR